jgi:hypothetical protein
MVATTKTFTNRLPTDARPLVTIPSKPSAAKYDPNSVTRDYTLNNEKAGCAGPSSANEAK